MLLRASAALALVLVVTACGAVQEAGDEASTAEAEPAPTEELLPAPPIEAIDEPASEDVLALVPPPPSVEGWTSYGPRTCVRPGVDPPVELGDPQGPCPDDQLRGIMEEERRVLPAGAPAPRTIARLRLEDGGAAYVVEYRSRDAGACLLFHVEDAAGLPTGGSGGGLPCSEGAETFCDAVCLVPVRWQGGDRVVVAGFADATADGIRIRFEDGYVARYPLTGPLLPADPERRIFMAEQAHGLHVGVELLQGDDVVAAEEELVFSTEDAEPPEELEGTPGVTFELEGRTLTVAIGPGAPPEAQALLADDEAVFVCTGLDDLEVEYASDDELPPSHAFGSFPPGERTLTVELAAPVSGVPAGCAAATDADAEDAAAYQFFVPWDELAQPED